MANTIKDIRNKLAGNPIVQGIALGSLPEDHGAKAPIPAKPAPAAEKPAPASAEKQTQPPQPVVFVNPSAAQCELDSIRASIEGPATILRTSRFVGLQGGIVVKNLPGKTGTAISPYAPDRYNVPLNRAGTFGAVVEAQGRGYLLSCNHAVAYNGRVPDGAPILTPGLRDDANGGIVLGRRSYFVSLNPPDWPPSNSPSTVNYVDCALAEMTPGPATQWTGINVFPGTPSIGTPISKNGSSSEITESKIAITDLDIPIDFSFGSYYFQGLIATYDGHKVFAVPGDSGSLAITGGPGAELGVGLVVARAYVVDGFGQFLSYIIALCSLSAVVTNLAAVMNLPPNSQLKFFV